MSDTVLTHMDTIISLCREHRAELLLVATPSPLNYNYERHNILAAYAEEHQRSFVESSAKKYMEGMDVLPKT